MTSLITLLEVLAMVNICGCDSVSDILQVSSIYQWHIISLLSHTLSAQPYVVSSSCIAILHQQEPAGPGGPVFPTGPAPERSR